MRKIYDVLYIIDEVEPLEGERFSFIPGTNQEYVITSLGRVISYRSQRAKVLKPTKNLPNGYYRVSLSVDGHIRNKLIH